MCNVRSIENNIQIVYIFVLIVRRKHPIEAPLLEL